MINIRELSAVNILLNVFHPQRWSSFEYFDPKWTKRVKKMSKYITKGEVVMDLGCGEMELRKYLKNNKYIGVDYKKRDKDTIVCDFNKKEFPKCKVDTVFVSGCLEYIDNPKWFVSEISKICNKCILSYCTMENIPNIFNRRSLNWVNNLKKTEVVNIFVNSGMGLQHSDKIANNTIFVFEK